MALYTRLTCMVLLGFAQTSGAADAVSVDGKLKAGMEYQSNVNISELKQASGTADSATVLDASINVGWQATDAFRIDTGYSINDKQYREVSDYDTRLHLAFIDTSYGFESFSVGANVYHAQADLAGNDFLTLNQYSLYTMHNISDSWFVRPSVTYADKQFSQLVERDATSNSAKLDSFWFFKQGKSFISIGASFEDESSQDNNFSYAAPGVNVRVSYEFDFLYLQHKVQLGYKLSQRAYVNAINGKQRDDVHQQIDAKWELAINSYLAVLTSAEYGDYQSILTSADYEESRVGLMLQASF